MARYKRYEVVGPGVRLYGRRGYEEIGTVITLDPLGAEGLVAQGKIIEFKDKPAAPSASEERAAVTAAPKDCGDCEEGDPDCDDCKERQRKASRRKASRRSANKAG